MNYFRTIEGKLVDVIDYSLAFVKEHPDTKIHIATDSQDQGKFTSYATVVVYRYNLRGAHFLFNKIKFDKIQDDFTRLFKEAELSLQLANWISVNSPLKVEAIELDYNGEKKTMSSRIIPAARGWCESLGYKVRVKPDEMMAAKAADHICRQ